MYRYFWLTYNSAIKVLNIEDICNNRLSMYQDDMPQIAICMFLNEQALRVKIILCSFEHLNVLLVYLEWYCTHYFRVICLTSCLGQYKIKAVGIDVRTDYRVIILYCIVVYNCWMYVYWSQDSTNFKTCSHWKNHLWIQFKLQNQKFQIKVESKIIAQNFQLYQILF